MSTETTYSEALLKLQKSEKYADIVLKGNDDIECPAIRCFLAARSVVFDKMLYGNFAEASKMTVPLPFSGDVIKSLVKYIYTDDIDYYPITKGVSVTKAEQEYAVKLMGLWNAAEFFALPNLKTKVATVVQEVIRKKPKISVICLHSCETKETETVVFDTIRDDPDEALCDNPAVALLSEATLRSILNEYLNVKELTLFKMVQEWIRPGEGVVAEQSAHFDEKDRISQGIDMIKGLSLERIKPDDIIRIVQPSGLVSESQLLETFKMQALMAVRRHAAFYDQTRTPTWSVSSNDHCEFHAFLLNHSPLRHGVHHWKLLIEKTCQGTWVGVASTEHNVDPHEWLGCQNGVGWVYGNNGAVCTFHPQPGPPYAITHPTYQAGDTLTFTLDLREDGKLMVKVNDGEPFLLFGDMKTHFSDECSTIGFVPAVSLCDPGKVKFLGFLD